MDEHVKIGLVGPVSPFRGGIAQYTDQLRRSLERFCRLETVSFTRLYPEIIYPGKSVKDKSVDAVDEPRLSYLIDSINPFTWIKAAKNLRDAGCKVVYLNWWTIFLAPA